jgi:FdhD protein
MKRFRAGELRAGSDVVACEEPLEIQVDGTPLAVVMRTPGHDRELALGFLVTERIVASPADVASVHHGSLGRDDASEGNVLRVHLRPDVDVDLEQLRRHLYASSSCGICGKASIEQVLATAPPLADLLHLDGGFFRTLPKRLRDGQTVFAETGGLHGAALFGADGRLRVVREDIGRHNAVDKVVGWAVDEGQLPLSGHVLLVSGRISFEVAQKALAARIPVVAAVSAPSSLAIELAERARLTLLGFLREGGFNVYGAAERISSDPGEQTSSEV